MRAPQWKGPSSASGTCLSWTTCCALKSEDGHPCNKQKENKTTSHQELLNASDPTSDSGAHRRWGDVTRSTAVGSPCPASAPAAGCFRTAATCRPGLSLKFNTLAAELPELSGPRAAPEQTSTSTEQWLLGSLLNLNNCSAASFTLPQNSLGQSLRLDKNIEVRFLQLLCYHFKNCWSKAEVGQVINDELKQKL